MEPTTNTKGRVFCSVGNDYESPQYYTMTRLCQWEANS